MSIALASFSNAWNSELLLLDTYRRSDGKFWNHDLFGAILMKRTFKGASFERGPLKPSISPNFTRNVCCHIGKFKKKSVGETKKTNACDQQILDPPLHDKCKEAHRY